VIHFDLDSVTPIAAEMPACPNRSGYPAPCQSKAQITRDVALRNEPPAEHTDAKPGSQKQDENQRQNWNTEKPVGMRFAGLGGARASGRAYQPV